MGLAVRKQRLIFLACSALVGNSSSPAAYVVSKNLHRRHLSNKQRALIAARIANIQRGQVGVGREKPDLGIPASESAELLNVSVSLVFDAKTLLAIGAPEEIEAVENG